MVRELEEYAKLEGSELGELCSLLCQIEGYAPYYLSKEFKKALHKEITEQLDNFKSKSKIVEREEQVTNKWKELEWYM